MKTSTNRLGNELSPYLLQHAHNPVDWYPWGEEAFERARMEDKPILISIGYSACHWCHVMERESFEDKATAAFMNRHFINIKVDREERPDVDEVYMEAVQYISGAGGWPLHCFLLPDGRPYYGGTYFPPTPAHNRPSWMQIMIHTLSLYQDKREIVEKQAERLIELIRQGSGKFLSHLENTGSRIESIADSLGNALSRQKDSQNGGFGAAPKFPHFMTLDLMQLLSHYDPSRLDAEHVVYSLERMFSAGIYDQIGGGIARYATDPKWNIPHFEKMLYDNALLVSSLAKLSMTNGEQVWTERLMDVLTFLERDFSRGGGFISAWDADSEGKEGKYYTWTADEITPLLEGENWILDFFNIADEGNWEERQNILWKTDSWDSFANKHGLDVVHIRQRWTEIRPKLLAEREKRVKPGADDKIILSWNAILSWSLAESIPVLKHTDWQEKGRAHLDWLLETFYQLDEGNLLRIHKEGQTYREGLLEDYAYLIKALLGWFGVEQDAALLQIAKSLAEKSIELFFDESANAFRSGDTKDLPVQQLSLYDNSIPSANAVMMENLIVLGHLYDEDRFRRISDKTLDSILPSVIQYPLAFSFWAQVLIKREWGFREISVIGKESRSITQRIQKMQWLPEVIFFSRQQEDESWPLSIYKDGGEKTYIYLCDRFGCRPPVETLDQLKILL